MRSLARLLGKTVLVVSGTLVMAGCSVTHGGNAIPAGGTSTSSTPSTTGSAVEGASDFGDLKACDLLSKVLEGKGFQSVQVDNLSSPNDCSSEKSLYASIGIALQAGAPYDQLDFDRDKQRPGDVNGRRAIQIRNGLGGDGACSIMMEQGPKSRVFVNTATTGMTTDQACDFVGSIAKAVEPMLPKVR